MKPRSNQFPGPGTPGGDRGTVCCECVSQSKHSMPHNDPPHPDDPSPDKAPALYATEPWERHVRETDREWYLFVAYRDSGYPQGPLGPFLSRKLKDLCTTHGAEYNYVRQLSSSYAWAWRCGHFDTMVDRRKTQLSLSDTDKLRADRARVRRKLRELAESELDKALTATERSGPENPLKVGELVTLVQAAFGRDGEDLADADAQTGTRVTLDLSKVRPTLDELRALRDVMARQALPAPIDTTGEKS